MKKIVAFCPGCNTSYILRNEMVGKKARCKKCSTIFVLQPVNQQEEVEFIVTPIDSDNFHSQQGSLKTASRTQTASGLIQQQREIIRYFTDTVTEYTQAKNNAEIQLKAKKRNAKNKLETQKRDERKRFESSVAELYKILGQISSNIKQAKSLLEKHWQEAINDIDDEDEVETPHIQEYIQATLYSIDEGAPIRYALILQQFDRTREQDVLMLIQSVGQVPLDKAQKLLRVPSLLKRRVSSEEARITIEKFNQVQALVMLITMEQLNEIQKSQSSNLTFIEPPDECYALILQEIEPTSRNAVFELLSSLTGVPATHFSQNLELPCVILRDATRDEVMMISQQFQNRNATVISRTMDELQELLADHIISDLTNAYL